MRIQQGLKSAARCGSPAARYIAQFMQNLLVPRIVAEHPVQVGQGLAVVSQLAHDLPAHDPGVCQFGVEVDGGLGVGEVVDVIG